MPRVFLSFNSNSRKWERAWRRRLESRSPINSWINSRIYLLFSVARGTHGTREESQHSWSNSFVCFSEKGTTLSSLHTLRVSPWILAAYRENRICFNKAKESPLFLIESISLMFGSFFFARDKKNRCKLDAKCAQDHVLENDKNLI